MTVSKISIPHVDALTQESITDDQAQFFLDNGFLVVRNVLQDVELKQVQDEMTVLYQRGASQVVDHPDYMYGKGSLSGKDVLRRIEYVIDKSDVMKALLGHPFILRSVEKLQGQNFVPTWDSMVLKAPNEGVIVEWHRDAEVPEQCTDSGPIFNVDFYLDEADLQTCLWVIPGSNKWSKEQSIARCSRPGFYTDDAVPVPMQPGDVIFHNILLLHGSPSGQGNPLRRTVYYEFRPGEIEMEFGPHTLEYIALKQHMLFDCIERRKQTAYTAAENAYTYTPDGAFAIHEAKKPDTYRYPHQSFFRK
ncbi:phytanoyl-CoA dioxygenase family protein [Alicyclobacillus fodiniaquatilis]|uniref:Phytanoyl-CoA dioxygenase family protein n=1 Tax=Alicyclobacillus fodiniaquatilis TaxID=1661150 RepID=A0ABW4JIM0_9BACL